MMPTAREVEIPTTASLKMTKYGATPSLEKAYLFKDADKAITFKFNKKLGSKEDNKSDFSLKFSNFKLIEEQKNESKTASFNLTLDGGMDVKIKKITPKSDIQQGEYQLFFEVEVDTESTLNFTAKGKAELNLAKLAGDELQCGTLKHEVEIGEKSSSIYAKGKIGGVKWRDNICLGGVQISAGFIPLIGNGKSAKAPLALDIFVGFNSSYELVVQGQISLSYHNFTKASVEVDLKNDDPKKRLNSFKESYDPDIYEATGRKEKSAIKIAVSGKLSGKHSVSVGLPIGLRVANIYMANIEPYAEVALEGEVSGLASIDFNGNVVTEFCKKLSLNPVLGVYFGVGMSASKEIKIDNAFFNKDIKDELTIGAYYTFKYKFDDLIDVDSCNDYDGEVNYDIVATNTGVKINNFTSTDKMDSIVYRIYDLEFNLLADMTPISDTSKEIEFELPSGDYIVETFMKTSNGKKKLENKQFKLKQIPKNIQVSKDKENTIVSWDSQGILTQYNLCVSTTPIINNSCTFTDMKTVFTNSYTLPSSPSEDINYYVALLGNVSNYDNSVLSYSKNSIGEILNITVLKGNGDFSLQVDKTTSKDINLSWEKPNEANYYKICQSESPIVYGYADACDGLNSSIINILDTNADFSVPNKIKYLYTKDMFGAELQLDKKYYLRVIAYDIGDNIIGFSTEVEALLVKEINTPTNLSDGLVAHYKFDGDANDSSGNGNHGTEYGGVTYVDGVIGKAGSFDGVDDYIGIPHDNTLNLSYDITISSWVNLSELTGLSDNNIIINKDGYNISYELAIQDSPTNYSSIPKYNLSFYLGDNGTPQDNGGWTDGGYNFVKNQWTLITITYDRSQVKTFVNGKIIKNYNTNSSMNTNSGDVRIGARGDNEAVSFFNGQIDDLRIYNRALNEAEIQELYGMGL